MHDEHLTLPALRLPVAPPPVPSGAPAPAGAPARLVDECGVAVELTGAVTRLGRSLTADVRSEDPTVSRRHAVVVREGAGFALLDDRSLNGVHVNGRRVARATLRDGDLVELGRHRFAFRESSTAANPATEVADAA